MNTLIETNPFFPVKKNSEFAPANPCKNYVIFKLKALKPRDFDLLALNDALILLFISLQ